MQDSSRLTAPTSGAAAARQLPPSSRGWSPSIVGSAMSVAYSSASWWRPIVASLPQGHRLPARDWERRHRGMLFILCAHAAGIFLYVLFAWGDLLHAVVEGGVIAVAAMLASWPRAGRRFRAIAACVGLLSPSA